MNYLTQLKEKSKKYNSIVCMGLDPVIDNIPLEGKPGEVIEKFYEKILNSAVKRNIFPASVKPNYAFYAQYGFDGIKALKSVIDMYRDAGIPVILDVKRGDIGKTAAAYAKESYDFFGADSVTLSPYLGLDSISPFTDNYPEKGSYILTKTSNKSSVEIQDVIYNGKPFYIYMAERLIEWYSPGMGSVVGATYPQQLEDISNLYIASGKEIPLLIPGIGSQGGDLNAVMKILKTFPDPLIHRINSSSAINFAWKKRDGIDFAEAAIDALDELNGEINNLL